jgi:hypothetical protein
MTSVWATHTPSNWSGRHVEPVLPWMTDSSIVEQHLDQPNGRARSCKRFRRAREALQIALTVPPVPGDVRPTRSCPVESSARPASTDGALWGSW